jgi:hypothetical protein
VLVLKTALRRHLRAYVQEISHLANIM